MSHPPFRADHVGSLLRPPELLRARSEHQAGRLPASDLRRVEDEAIRDAVRMQQEIGLEGVTDGEFRRGSWHMDFLYQIGGVAKTDQTLRIQFRNESGPVEAALGAFRIGGKLSLEKTIFAEDFAYLKSVAPAGTVAKLTIPSPSMLHYRGGRAVIDQAAYPDWTPSGTTSPRSTGRRSPALPHSAAAICSSTTPASPTSTTRRSAPTSRASAVTASISI